MIGDVRSREYEMEEFNDFCLAFELLMQNLLVLNILGPMQAKNFYPN